MITLDSILLEADKVKADEPDEGAEGNDTDTATDYTDTGDEESDSLSGGSSTTRACPIPNTNR